MKVYRMLEMKTAIVAVAAMTISISNAFAQGGWTDDGSIVRLTTSTDLVGIGTSSPSNTLTVKSTSWSEGLRLAYDGTDYGVIIAATDGLLFRKYGSSGTDIAFSFRNDGDTHLIDVLANGNVGIGDASPSEKLEVNANIKCDTIKCDAVKINGWTLNAPDYVFAPGYKKPSLAEVERYIKKNRHLPDVPSATEIQNEGLDLSQMNLALLKQVEILVLHTIEQDKRIEALEKEMKRK